MGRSLRRLIARLERRSGWLLVLGLAAAVLVNARQWRKDRQTALRLRAQRSAPPPVLTQKAPLPRVSLLIPAWNEAVHLAACLHSILAMRYPEKEVVVCAGGRDGTLDIARQFTGPGVIVFEQIPGEGKQRALQRCFERSTGEIIFLTDADSCLDDECFERTLAPVANGREAAATGSRQPLAEQRRIPLVAFQWANHLYQEGSLPDYVNILFGINAAVCRDALEKAGAFNGQAPIGTDLHLAHRLTDSGFRIRLIRHSRVQTEYQANPSAYIRQQSRWFRNRFLYGLRDRAWGDVIGHLRAGLAAAFMLVGPLAAVFDCKLMFVPWLSALVHLILAQARLAFFARLVGVDLLTPISKAFAIIPCMAAGWLAQAGGLIDSLIPARRGKW